MFKLILKVDKEIREKLIFSVLRDVFDIIFTICSISYNECFFIALIDMAIRVRDNGKIICHLNYYFVQVFVA